LLRRNFLRAGFHHRFSFYWWIVPKDPNFFESFELEHQATPVAVPKSETFSASFASRHGVREIPDKSTLAASIRKERWLSRRPAERSVGFPAIPDHKFMPPTTGLIALNDIHCLERGTILSPLLAHVNIIWCQYGANFAIFFAAVSRQLRPAPLPSRNHAEDYPKFREAHCL
jgi:hypothetical protein